MSREQDLIELEDNWNDFLRSRPKEKNVLHKLRDQLKVIKDKLKKRRQKEAKE